MQGSLNRSSSVARARILARWTSGVVVFLGFPVGMARAQFLRIGPFDFNAVGKLEGIYTTNVEGEREEEPEEQAGGEGQPAVVEEEEWEDYYYVASLALNSKADLTPNTEVNLDTGIAWEEHFNRPDLNNSSQPFGRASLDTATRMRHLELRANVQYERTLKSEEGVYDPLRRKTRDPQTSFSYGADLLYEYASLRLAGGYAFSQERHDEEEFQDADQDETTWDFNADWAIGARLNVDYKYERTKTEELDEPEPDEGQAAPAGEDVAEEPAEWEESQSVGLRFRILKRPDIGYQFAYEKDGDEDWEATHTLDIRGDEPILETPTVTVKVNADYSYEKDPEDDDITFTYGASVEHRISRTATHSLTAKREPAETLGSSADTDEISVAYRLTKDDLFIYNLSLSLNVGFTRSEPMAETPPAETETADADAAPVEESWDYGVQLRHVRILTRKLQRAIQYSYSLEESNLEDEPLEEHRVILTFEYLF